MDTFVEHQGVPDSIRFITMDMSKAFQSGARKQFPEAEIGFDAFHISQLVHDALEPSDERKSNTRLLSKDPVGVCSKGPRTGRWSRLPIGTGYSIPA